MTAGANKGCAALALLLVTPLISLACVAWEAFVVQRIWQWDLSAYATPWPFGAVAAALAIKWTVFYRRRPKIDKEDDAKTITLDLLVNAIVPATALFIGWAVR